MTNLVSEFQCVSQLATVIDISSDKKSEYLIANIALEDDQITITRRGWKFVVSHRISACAYFAFRIYVMLQIIVAQSIVRVDAFVPRKLATIVSFPSAFAERTVAKLTDDNSETSVAERYQLRVRRASRSPKTSCQIFA